MPELGSARWILAGRVQGVGFRWFVLRQALELGIVGWVSNLPDGRVEVVGRGPKESMIEFERRIRRGPRLAQVGSVEKLDLPHEVVRTNTFVIK